MRMHHSLEHLLTIPSFVGWIKGECSPREQKHWDEWESEDVAHVELAREARDIVEAARSEYVAPDPQVELQKLNRELRRRKRQRPEPRPAYRSRPAWWQRTGTVAAGLIFIITLLGGLFAYQYTIAEKGDPEIAASQKTFHKSYTRDDVEKVTFALSDGLHLILNANSTLRFSSSLQKGLNTQVWLEGEAYFDIAHLEGDRRRRFTVHTGDGDIRVLGTKFAVNTFGGGTQTALERGRINIRIKEDGEVGVPSPEFELSPGEMAQFAAGDNKIAVKEADMRLYTSWTKDIFTFAQASMGEVARRIERTFGVEVVVGQQYRDECVTGTIRSDNLDVLTRALAKVLHTEVNQRAGKLQIEATVEREHSKEID